MFRWLLDLLCGSISVEWESAYGFEESVARLRSATKKSAFSALAEQAAVGTVTESKVKLQRVIPMVHNSFKPFFMGQFVRRGEHVFLIGRFTMLGAVKLFMSVWLGFVVVFAIAALFTQTATKPGGFPFVLGPFAMGGFGVALVCFGKWLARNDAAWLGDVIKRAIGGSAGNLDSAPVAATATSAPSFAGRPTVVLITSGVLGLMGVMNIVGAVLRVSSTGRDPFGLLSTYWSGAFRYAAAAEGLLLLAIAAGIFMRSRIAWAAGFLMIASAWVYSVASVFLMDEKTGPPPALKIVFGAFGLLVTFYWGRWWYAQRVHFVTRRESSVGSVNI